MVDEAWQAQRTETELSMFHVRMVTTMLTLVETDVKQAEAANKKKKNSSSMVSHSPAQTETDQTTHSENLPRVTPSAEEITWQRFQTAYARLPHPGKKEPILYVEQDKDHDDSVLNEIQEHYQDLKDTLDKLAQIPISLPTRIPQLEHAAAFQKQIPEYLKLCRKYLRMTNRAR